MVPGIGVEVIRGQRRQFAIATPSQQGGGDERAEIGRTSVREPFGLILRQVSQPGGVSFPERPDLAPSLIAGTTPLPVRVI
jgi:hypothetical protein